jgi:hypothetical protein
VSTASTTHPIGTHDPNEVLYEAITTAGYAPSIQHSQPWRWRLAGDTLDLFIERRRMLHVTDPDDRLATLSCGAALHHARVAVAAQGRRATVTRMPDPADPDHLARLHIDGPAPTEPDVMRRAGTVRQRHTDALPAMGRPVRPEDLRAIAEAVESQDTRLRILRADQVVDLAAATGRDVTRRGDPPVTHEHDRPAVVAVLHGPGDRRLDWLRAGEALSAGWLTATELGVSVLPLDAPTEVAGAGETLRRLLPGLGHPYLALRLGGRPTAGPAAGPLTASAVPVA